MEEVARLLDEFRRVRSSLPDVKRILEQQADWQRSRRDLSWPEKLRMATACRETLLIFRELRASQPRRRPAL